MCGSLLVLSNVGIFISIFGLLVGGISYPFARRTDQKVCSVFNSKDDCQAKCGCYWCPHDYKFGTCYSLSYSKYCSNRIIQKKVDNECIELENQISNLLKISTSMFVSSLLVIVILYLYPNSKMMQLITCVIFAVEVAYYYTVLV
jgi:hypothetical protein